MADLFNDWQQLPANVLAIIERMEAERDTEHWDYANCKHYRKELEKLGYTYDFGLDGEPYDLRKIKDGRRIRAAVNYLLEKMSEQ